MQTCANVKKSTGLQITSPAHGPFERKSLSGANYIIIIFSMNW